MAARVRYVPVYGRAWGQHVGSLRWDKAPRHEGERKAKVSFTYAETLGFRVGGVGGVGRGVAARGEGGELS